MDIRKLKKIEKKKGLEFYHFLVNTRLTGITTKLVRKNFVKRCKLTKNVQDRVLIIMEHIVPSHGNRSGAIYEN